MIRIAVMLVVLVVAGCASPHKLAECRGPKFPLNLGMWQPTAEDMK